MSYGEDKSAVNASIGTSQGLSWEEWHVNLIKDGGRRVMYGGNAYEDDLEPAAGEWEPGQECPAPVGGA
jgi:hypothetical protein